MKTYILPIFILFVLLGISSPTQASLPVSTSIDLRQISKLSNDTSEVNIYCRRALSNILEPGKLDFIKANIDSAELICKKKKLEIPALLHLARAEYFYQTNDFNNSSSEAKIAMYLSEKSGEKDVYARTLNFLGRYNLRIGFFEDAIDYFNKSIDFSKKNKLKKYIPLNYEGLADLYNSVGDVKEFRNTLQSMIDAATSENDTVLLEIGYVHFGTSLTEYERDFNRADLMLRKCLEISSKKNDTNYIILSLANIGWNYYQEKLYDSSLVFYNRSLNYSIPGKRYSYSANSFGNIGTIYRDLGDIEKSLENYSKSIYQGKLAKDVYNLSWVYKDLSDMYLRNKDTTDAYINYVLYKEFNDSLVKKNNRQGLTDAKIRYDADTNKKELELLSLRIRNQRLLIYGFTGLFILSFAIGLLIFNRSKINSKRRISEMNRKISEVTQANLRQQMNPHFIFNTLNSIQYYMYQHDKLATNVYLTKFASLMRKVLENSQHTSIPLRDELDALTLYLDLEKIRFKEKFDYDIKIDDEIDTLLFKVPTMLIQPYVENSICHGLIPGEIKGIIKIDLKLENEYISCTIEDNGIGREAAQEKKSKNDSNHNSLGTQIVSSRLDLVNALYGSSLKTIYTDLKNANGEPTGTRVEIHIPIMI
jgi:tetratricopeptide (TPR) repeat protein